MATLVGQNIGQYKIVRLIGEGGMAVVYQARQESIKRDVAIKVIRPGLTDMQEFSRRFQQEAQTVASLSHAHILKIFDYGEQDDIVYLVMELLTGGSLDQLIKQGPLSLSRASVLLDQIASALDYAHHKGIVHRDLKPENILLDESGNPFITDFGLAKLLNSSTKLTQSGAALGTPAYMAPEQWRAEALDARTDVYALGVVLFEMLSGTVPFNGDSALSMMYLHLHEPPRSLREQNPAVPMPVQQVIEKALAKLPDDRYQSAGALAADFRAAASGQAPIVSPTRKTARQGTTNRTQPMDQPPEKKGMGAITVILMLAIVALVAGIGITVVQRLRPTPTVSLPTSVALAVDPSLAGSGTPIAQPSATSGRTATAGSGSVATQSETQASSLAPSASSTASIAPTTATPALPSATPTLKFTIAAQPGSSGGISGAAGPPDGGLALVGHSAPVNSVAFSPDGKYLASGSDDQTARLWERTTGKLVSVFAGHSGAVKSVAISPKGDTLLTGGADDMAILWDLASGTRIRTYQGHTDALTSVAFSPKGDYVLTTSLDKTAILWDTKTGQQVRTFKGHTAVVNHGAFSPSGTQIVTASADMTAVIWDLQSGNAVRTLSGHSAALYTAIFSPGDGYILTGAADGTARLWKTADGSLYKTLSANKGQNIFSVAFSPDGNECYTTSEDGQVYAWSTLSGQLLHPMGPPAEATIKEVAFAPRPLLQFAVALDDDRVVIYSMGGPAAPPGSGSSTGGTFPGGPGARPPTPAR